MQSKTLSKFCLSVITAALLLPSAPSMASCCQPDPCCPTCTSPGLRDGFYLGIGAGYDTFKLTRTRTFTSPTVALAESIDHTANGWMGSLFGGYGMYFQNVYYLGAELFGNDTAAENSHSSTRSGVVNIDTSLNPSWSYGVNLLPGYKINCDTLLYVRLGYMRTEFKDSISGTTATGIPFSWSNTEWFNGYTYGLGLETAVAANLSVRGEYNHTNYSSQTFNAPGSGTTFTASSKVSPSDNQFVFSLIYHFC